MKLPCLAVFVIFNALLCSGITDGVQLKGGALVFNLSPIDYGGAQKEDLRTVMAFIVAVAVAKTINFCYTIDLSTCPIYAGFSPSVLASISASQLNFRCHNHFFKL